jgi:hypothetical protein
MKENGGIRRGSVTDGKMEGMMLTASKALAWMLRQGDMHVSAATTTDIANDTITDATTTEAEVVRLTEIEGQGVVNEQQSYTALLRMRNAKYEMRSLLDIPNTTPMLDPSDASSTDNLIHNRN